MKMQLISSCGVLVLTTFVAISAWGQKMNAGLWEAKSQIRVNGIPLPTSTDEECVSKETAQNLKTKLSAELDKKGCKLEKWNLKKQKLQAELSCEQGDLKARGALSGTVTAKTYDLSGDADGSYKGIPSVASLNLSGQWKGDCKATAKE